MKMNDKMLVWLVYFKIHKFHTIFDLREGQREKQMILLFFFRSCQTVGNVLVLHEIFQIVSSQYSFSFISIDTHLL